MQNLDILNSKEIKEIKKLLLDQFGFSKELDYAFLKNKDEKIFLLSRDFARLDTKELRIDSLGLYFGKVERGEIRLSIEGSQIIGPYCTKNVLAVSDDEVLFWIAGDDLGVQDRTNGVYIVKNNDDFLGCGKLSGDKFYNFVPKPRRVKLSD